MKHLLYIFVAALFLAACEPSKTTTISGSGQSHIAVFDGVKVDDDSTVNVDNPVDNSVKTSKPKEEESSAPCSEKSRAAGIC